MPTIHSEAHALRFGTGVILSMASAFAIAHGIPSIWLALHKEDADEAVEYSSKFITFMNSGIKLIGEQCEIKAPFHNWSKSKIMQHASELGIPLQKTMELRLSRKGRSVRFLRRLSSTQESIYVCQAP